MNLSELKNTLLGKYHTNLNPIVHAIAQGHEKHQEKARIVNRKISEYHQMFVNELGPFDTTHDQQQALIVLQYCTSVVSLEYRHRVWPYEYMALSRRVGELWERFCSSAWDSPSRDNIQRIEAPSFRAVENTIRLRISDNLSSSPNLKDILKYI